MEDSIFNDLDVDTDEISDNPFEVPDGTYLCIVGKAYKEEKDNKRTFRIVYNVHQPESPQYRLPIREKFRLPMPHDVVDGSIVDKQLERELSKLKNRCKTAFSMTNQEFNGLRGEHLLGKLAYVTVKNNPDKEDPTKIWTNVVSVVSVDQYEANNDLQYVGADDI